MIVRDATDCVFDKIMIVNVCIYIWNTHKIMNDIRTKKSTRSPSKSSTPRLPNDALLSWSGTLRRFSRMREGGPGRPVSLAVTTLLALGLGYWGIDLLEKRGIDSFGPAMVFISVFWLLFLILWVLIKAGLRDNRVHFYISKRGVGIIPSSDQKKLDRKIGIITRIVFLLTFKGGQWSAWQPFTPWKSVRRVEIDHEALEILIHGGNWDIRLPCSRDIFPKAYNIIQELVPPRTRLIEINHKI